MKNSHRQQKLPAVLKTGTRTEEYTDWLKKHFEEKQDSGLPREQLYLLFSKYCDDITKQVECREIFGKLVAETFPAVCKRRLGGRAGLKYYYWGLDVKEASVHAKELENHRTSLLSDRVKSTSRLRNVKSCISKEKKTRKCFQARQDTADAKDITIKNNTTESEIETNRCSVLPDGSARDDVAHLVDCSASEENTKCSLSGTDAGSVASESNNDNSSDAINISASCDSFHSSKMNDVSECEPETEQSLDLVSVRERTTEPAAKARRQGRRNAFSVDASFSAQKRKASNCTCTDCAKHPKRKKSKVHRMSEILASPRMRSSLRQAIRASLAESNSSVNPVRLKFTPKGSSISADPDMKQPRQSGKSTLNDKFLQAVCKQLEVQACESGEPDQALRECDDSDAEEITTISDSFVGDVQKATSGIEVRLNSNDLEVNSQMEQLDGGNDVNQANQFKANPRVWRFLPPLLKKLHKEKVKKWLGEEFEWSPPSCLPRHRVYEHYESFCNKHLSCAAPPATLGKMLQEKFRMLSMRRLGGRNNYKYYYKGIDIQPSSSAYDKLSKDRILTSPKPKLSRVFNGQSKAV